MLFFSGHTAIAVSAASEVARVSRRWLTGVGGLIVVSAVLAEASGEYLPITILKLRRTVWRVRDRHRAFS
jgi:hypothetical protein